MVRRIKIANFLNEIGKDSTEDVVLDDNRALRVVNIRAGRYYVEPLTVRKWASLGSRLRRLMGAREILKRSGDSDAVLLDNSVTTFLVLLWQAVFMRRKPMVIARHFNVLRRRSALANAIGCRIFGRMAFAFVHSTYDVELLQKLYRIPKERVGFMPFIRGDAPTRWVNDDSVHDKIKGPYFISFGSNARDYKTLIEAVRDTEMRLLVVARRYNLEGIEVPFNVVAKFDLPIAELDGLASLALASVFCFDGSEPSCGQISVVSSFLLGKPIVVTRSFGMQDYVIHESNGLVVESGDIKSLKAVLRKLWCDHEFRQRLAEGATAWASENLDPERASRSRYSTVYEIVERVR